MVRKLNEILTGYYHYYGITDNSKSLRRMYQEVKRSLYYWLNRRSQKRSYTWEGYKEMLRAYPLKNPKIYVSIFDN